MVALIVNKILLSMLRLGFSKKTHVMVLRGAQCVLLID